MNVVQVMDVPPVQEMTISTILCGWNSREQTLSTYNVLRVTIPMQQQPDEGKWKHTEMRWSEKISYGTS